MVIWNNSDAAVIKVTSAVDGHGWILEDGVNAPLWYEGDCLPTIMMKESLLEEKRSDISDVEKEVDEM